MARTDFLNVDLDVETQNLDELIPILEQKLVLVSQGGPRATFELNEQPANPDEAIQGLCAAIESLEGRARDLWDACTARSFDIGIESGTEPHSTIWPLQVDTLTRVARLQGTLAITVYSVQQRPDAKEP
ncbi:hypothetical protein SAMN05443572_107435 [Myxococcus fulvus]|uniref:Uncharacterized protein n=1 Tax=Myxococcus fulvus TaxID=33 RepID=A0A511TDN8_MYXFU|nr:hypothetical protein [Myxococcus fulvus]GEN12279.1 hypothetical protein MFU01_73160 [Myxococcus fulvus]SEU27342.1 hypothetical protein SAMN05443572_107435 [Myxococcus fulvus]